MLAFENLDYLVTGICRSGTGYISKWLTANSIDCGHEILFSGTDLDAAAQQSKITTLSAESSWFAAPFLLNPYFYGVKKIHIVRDPLKTINSIYKLGIVDENSVNNELRHILKYFPELTNISDLADRTALFYCKWNNLIKNQFVKQHSFYQIEHLDILRKDLNLGTICEFDDLSYNNKNSLKQNVKNILISDIKNSDIREEFINTIKYYDYDIDTRSTTIKPLKNNMNSKNGKIKVHIYGLPHTLTIRDHPQMMTCAYTTKIWLLCEKLMQEGHEVIHYGVEIPEKYKDYMVPCTEHVACIPYDLWEKTHGQRDANSTFHEHSVDLPTYNLAIKTFPEEIIKRIKDPSREVVLASFGYWSVSLLEIGDHAPLIEFGIGYDAVFANYKIFESYSWMHTVYGMKDTHLQSPGWFDAVVPGYVKPEEFEFKSEKQDYLLCLGRMIDTKGIHVAAQLTKDRNIKLILAGNGNVDWIKDFPNIEYVGVVGIEEKRKLLANAKATMCNTHYVEPFGNVHVESLMSGTPVITTDWGVYVESVPHGEVGFRGRTWDDFVYALDHIGEIDPQRCRDWAMANFSLDAVYPKFNSYFEKCAKHYTAKKGWYFDYNTKNYFVNYTKNYEEFTKIHLTLIINDDYFHQSRLAIESFALHHDNFDLTIIDIGLSDQHVLWYENLRFFSKRIKANHTPYWSKAIYANEIATSGVLLILDADTVVQTNLGSFLKFNDNRWLNATHDYATFQQQNDFNLERSGDNTTFHEAFKEKFPDWHNYKDKTTINAGLLCFNLNNDKAKEFLNSWSEVSTELEDKIQTWPNEQGALNHLIYTTKDIYAVNIFDPTAYNRTMGSADDWKLPEVATAKLVHYHKFKPPTVLTYENSSI